MKQLLTRTINYHAIQTPPTSGAVNIRQLVQTSFAAARTAGERLKEGSISTRACLANTISSGPVGLEITFLTFDPGYRPKKIERSLSNACLSPVEISLALNEEVAEIIHLLLRHNHAILESRQGAGSSHLISIYLTWLIQKIDRSFSGVLFTPAASPGIVQEMRRHGVRKIEFDVLAPSNDGSQRQSHYDNISRRVSRLNGARAHLVFCPKNRRHLEVSEAESVLYEIQEDEGSEKICIHLGNDTIIRPDQFRLKKTVHVENDGTKNARSGELFQKMSEVYLEWVNDGYIQDPELAPLGQSH